jgi:hypothetical protein
MSPTLIIRTRAPYPPAHPATPFAVAPEIAPHSNLSVPGNLASAMHHAHPPGSGRHREPPRRNTVPANQVTTPQEAAASSICTAREAPSTDESGHPGVRSPASAGTSSPRFRRPDATRDKRRVHGAAKEPLHSGKLHAVHMGWFPALPTPTPTERT